MNNKKIALYIRVASADDESMKNQEHLMREYAADRGYSDVVVYRDNGKSGLSLDRTGMNELVAEIRNGNISTVITKDLSRIARDWKLTHAFLDFLKEHGIELVTRYNEL